MHGLAHCGLQSGEGEVAVLAALQRTREIEAPRIAGARLPFHLRAAGIAEAEELRHLVEGLAQGIVDGGAKAMVAADAVDDLELGVAAGDQQQKIGEGAGLRAALPSARGLQDD